MTPLVDDDEALLRQLQSVVRLKAIEKPRMRFCHGPSLRMSAGRLSKVPSLHVDLLAPHRTEDLMAHETLRGQCRSVG